MSAILPLHFSKITKQRRQDRSVEKYEDFTPENRSWLLRFRTDLRTRVIFDTIQDEVYTWPASCFNDLSLRQLRRQLRSARRELFRLLDEHQDSSLLQRCAAQHLNYEFGYSIQTFADETYNIIPRIRFHRDIAATATDLR